MLRHSAPVASDFGPDTRFAIPKSGDLPASELLEFP